MRLNPARFAAISGHLAGLCGEAGETTFTSEHELSKILARQPATPPNLLIVESAAYENAAQCGELGSSNTRDPSFDVLILLIPTDRKRRDTSDIGITLKFEF